MKVIRTVNLLPLNKEKTQICLLKKVSQDKYDGKWCLPGESIKPEETNNSAIIRIIKEQMNAKASNFKEFKKTENRAKFAVIKSQYLIGTLEGDNIILDKRKYSNFKWFDLNHKLLELDYAFDEAKIVLSLLESLKLI